MTDRDPNHYEILGVPADASELTIRRAYRDHAKTAHPDAGGDARTFQRLLEAYETLTDRQRRREYDDRMGIRLLIEPTSGGAARAGWSHRSGDFTGDVEFPGWMRSFTDSVWQPRGSGPEPAAPAGAPATGEGPPADVVWWFPESATAPPVVHGPLVLVATGRRLVALTVEFGTGVWNADLGSEVIGSPAVIGDLVYARTTDGAVHAVELSRGVTRWARPAGPPASVGLLGTETDLVMAGVDGRMLALEPADGSLRWIAKVEGPPAVALVASGGVVLCATSRQSLEAVDLRTGRHHWRLSVRPNLDIPPCPAGETVWLAGVAGAGSLVRVAMATGAPAGSFSAGQAVAGLVADTLAPDGPANATSTPERRATDGPMVMASVAGPARLIAVDGGGRVHLDVALANVMPEPALDDRFAYLADPEGAVVVIDRRGGGRIVRQSTVPFAPSGPPVLAAERIILRARDGRLWATTRPDRNSPE